MPTTPIATRRAFLGRAVGSAVAAAALQVVGGPLAATVTQAAAPSNRRTEIRDFPGDAVAADAVSAPRALPANATHAGLHWRGAARHEAVVSFRLRSNNAWSAWEELTLDD